MIQTQATVTAIEQSPDKQTVFIYFKPAQTFSFYEGQFMFLERIGFTYPDGKVMKNAYSIGTTNDMLQKTGIIGTIVKKSTTGGMSEYLTSIVRVGDTIKCTAPLGHFIDTKIAPNYLFISIGSGITPVFALYTECIQQGNDNKIVNIFGERFAKNILPTVQQSYQSSHANIKHLLYLSQEKDIPAGRQKGHIQDGVDEAFDFFGGENIQVFLCGKPDMVNELQELLMSKGIPKDHIFFEKY